MPNIPDDNFMEYLILFLILLLFAKDIITPYLRGVFEKVTGIKTNDRPATSAQMEALVDYYNHDTTEILNTIKKNTESSAVANKNIVEGVRKVETKIDDIQTTTNAVHRKQDEWERHGVPLKTKS